MFCMHIYDFKKIFFSQKNITIGQKQKNIQYNKRIQNTITHTQKNMNINFKQIIFFKFSSILSKKEKLSMH